MLEKKNRQPQDCPDPKSNMFSLESEDHEVYLQTQHSLVLSSHNYDFSPHSCVRDWTSMDTDGSKGPGHCQRKEIVWSSKISLKIMLSSRAIFRCVNKGSNRRWNLQLWLVRAAQVHGDICWTDVNQVNPPSTSCHLSIPSPPAPTHHHHQLDYLNDRVSSKDSVLLLFLCILSNIYMETLESETDCLEWKWMGQ